MKPSFSAKTQKQTVGLKQLVKFYMWLQNGLKCSDFCTDHFMHRHFVKSGPPATSEHLKVRNLLAE